ncbi:hypothetical protein [Pedobacter sp. P26]|uniref:hypothetical protein n=1 Tax=Pedobacter sp. P26 TaxID=3423956 RepID=UPI003D66C9B8
MIGQSEKGMNYGMIIVNAETGRPIDLLDSRDMRLRIGFQLTNKLNMLLGIERHLMQVQLQNQYLQQNK